MKRLMILVVMVTSLATVTLARAEDWKPAAGPLMTRWAKEVSPDNAHPEYPRPQMVRKDWLNLNGLWQLGEAAAGERAPSGKELPRRILVPFPIESALSGVMARAERVWYRRTFQIPEQWQGRRVLLHFQAVDWEATVSVNGTQVGTHRGGYDAFSMDITDALKPSGQQELIVGVYDPTDDPEHGNQPRGKQVKKPGGIFYTPTTGVWQTVWLEPVPAARIGRLTLIPDVDASCLRLIIEGIGTGAGNTIEAVARDGEEEVARAANGVGTEIKIEIPKNKLKLWSPASPFLYDLAVTLNQGDAPIDRVESYFGMRKIELAKDESGLTKMRLNGEFLFQIGPLDQGFWPDGLYTAPTDEALRYDVEVTRRLGFNMTRKHVKIEPQRWYYWCDKLGLLVWQDMPSGDNKTSDSRIQFEKELRRMVAGLQNHPSIIMWVIFNEGWGQHDTARHVEAVKKLDPSRLVSNASGWTDEKVGDVLDVHKYPGPAAPEPEPNRAGVLGEFGGLGLGVDGHTWADKTWGYRGTASSQELTRRYQTLLGRVWEFKESHGLSAAVYTQITDVETECNGLLTYDRAVIKPDLEKVAAANRGLVPKRKVVVATSQAKAIPWRYTFEKPADEWVRPEFDDSSWKVGPAGFGTKETPGAIVRTEWNAGEIWLRRRFELPEMKTDDLALLVHHDEDVEIHTNGVLAGKATGYTVDYEDLSLTPEGRAALKPGENLMAVHCKQTGGGQYIDVGIVELVMPGPTADAAAEGQGEGQAAPGDVIPVKNPKTLGVDKIPCQRIAVGEPDDYKPCVAMLPGGELLLTAFHQYKKDGGKYLEQNLLFRSRDGGRTWSKPEKLDLLGREPYLTVLGDGTIFITGHLLHSDVRNKYGYIHGYVHRSTDGGKTWQSTRMGNEELKPGASTHSTRNVLELADGTLLLGVDAGGGPHYMWRSTDRGKTWDRSQRCEPVGFKSRFGFFGGETWLWLANSGKIIAFCRVDSKEFPIEGRSTVAGTWDHHDHEVLYASTDQGRTFRRVADFGDYGEMYPSLLRLRDGRLLYTFTVRDLKPPLGVRAVVGTEQDDGFVFDLEHDRLIVDTKTPVDKTNSGGGFGPTVQLTDGTLVTSCSYRGADDQTHLEVVRWRLPEPRK